MKFDRNHTNMILATDSYKLTHWRDYPEDTTGIYSYFESRKGAKYPYTVFFGLQAILKRYLLGSVVTWADIDAAHELARSHFATNEFNYKGWAYIIERHGGRLPIRIKAVPEGSPIPINNVMMTVENTDPNVPWLTNAVEPMLTHLWYPSVVATLSRLTKELILRYVQQTGGDPDAVKFMLHDFGYRGASSHESAEIAGAAHLVNFVGTDTLPGMVLALRDYGADLGTLAFSVPATEHSVMTAEGEQGELTSVLPRLLKNHPTGILSVVADSFDVYQFVNAVGTTYKDQICDREGVLVIRPDSTTEKDPTPESMMVTLMEMAWHHFGGEHNQKGFRVLDPHVRFLWGDGLDYEKIERILGHLEAEGFAAQNMATFGMGGGLLQKGLDRDTQRSAFKMAAIKRGENGVWTPVHKTTHGKESKAGRLHLNRADGRYETVAEANGLTDELVTVFEDGKLVTEWTFDQVRENAQVSVPVTA